MYRKLVNKDERALKNIELEEIKIVTVSKPENRMHVTVTHETTCYGAC